MTLEFVFICLYIQSVRKLVQRPICSARFTSINNDKMIKKKKPAKHFVAFYIKKKTRLIATDVYRWWWRRNAGPSFEEIISCEKRAGVRCISVKPPQKYYKTIDKCSISPRVVILASSYNIGIRNRTDSCHHNDTKFNAGSIQFAIKDPTKSLRRHWCSTK